jgi:triacylglycerol esterase/lipase EstA (alpha/beta hydrolase family)
VAIVGGLAWLVGHAFWLALSFALAKGVGRDDPAPQATLAQVLAAWWGEVIVAPQVFFWRQPFRARAFPDALPAQAHGRTGVLLVHGFVCNRGLWNPWLRQLAAQGVPVVAVSLEPVFGSIDDYVAEVEDAVRRLEQATGAKPLLVGHSMGGLAIRAWMRDHRGEARVQGVVSIGTPHQGTWLARWSFSANGRQMRLGSAWLGRLAASETASSRRLFLCIYSHCDNVVFPASSACLPGAEICHVPATAHVDLIHHPRVMAEVLARLHRGPVAAEPPR